jgi:hypothetical protein
VQAEALVDVVAEGEVPGRARPVEAELGRLGEGALVPAGRPEQQQDPVASSAGSGTATAWKASQAPSAMKPSISPLTISRSGSSYCLARLGENGSASSAR